MKRHNIYLYEYRNNLKGKGVGFCRMDVYDDSVKLLFNIKCKDLGIVREEIVDIRADLLLEGGNRQQLSLNVSLSNINSYNGIKENVKATDIVGVYITYVHKNGISTRIIGELQGVQGVTMTSEDVVKPDRIKRVELEDTVYNVDMECLSKKKEAIRTKHESMNINVSGMEYELVRIKPEELTSLPRDYWKLLRNKFVICKAARYGHIAYIKQSDRYIVCVPGNADDRCAGCARRFGFKSFMPCVQNEMFSENMEDEASGYWIMGMAKNRK